MRVAMDSVIEASQVEPDRKKRKELIAKLQAIAAEDMPVLDLFEIRFFTLANRKVREHTDSAEGVYGSFKNTWLQK